MPSWNGGIQGLEPQWLVLGSALIALGMTTILAAILAAWRSRRRPSAAVESAPTTARLDTRDDEARGIDPRADLLAPEFALLDRRLEDVERLVTGLSRRLDAVTVAARPISPAKSKPVPLPAAPPRRSAEHEALRALAGRA